MLQAAGDGDADTELGVVMVNREMRLKMENIDSGPCSGEDTTGDWSN